MMAMTTSNSIRVNPRGNAPPPRDRAGPARKGEDDSRMVGPPDMEGKGPQTIPPDGGTG